MYKQKIIKIASEILSGKIGIIDGACKLSTFQFGYGLEEDKDLLFFVGIASETEHLPVGEVRKQWNKNALFVKDKEIKEAENYYSVSAKKACESLIEKMQ